MMLVLVLLLLLLAAISRTSRKRKKVPETSSTTEGFEVERGSTNTEVAPKDVTVSKSTTNLYENCPSQSLDKTPQTSPSLSMGVRKNLLPVLILRHSEGDQNFLTFSRRNNQKIKVCNDKN